MRNLNRREFLSITAAVLELTFISWPGAAAAAAAAAEDSPLDLSYLPVKIGFSYLVLFPAEQDLDGLKQALEFDRGFSPAELQARLVAKIQADYESGRTFKYEGWVLSHTEGRLCALAKLNYV